MITFETLCLSHAWSSVSVAFPFTLPVGLNLYQKGSVELILVQILYLLNWLLNVLYVHF